MFCFCHIKVVLIGLHNLLVSTHLSAFIKNQRHPVELFCKQTKAMFAFRFSENAFVCVLVSLTYILTVFSSLLVIYKAHLIDIMMLKYTLLTSMTSSSLLVSTWLHLLSRFPWSTSLLSAFH